MKTIFVSNICSWKPPANDPAAFPKLEFCDPIFRRRLSQLSKMTIQVAHDFFLSLEKSKIDFGERGTGGGQTEHAEQSWQAERSERGGQIERGGQAEHGENCEQIGQAEHAEQIGQAENCEQIEHAEHAERGGQAEHAERGTAPEQIEQFKKKFSNLKIVFASKCGEISRQFKINKSLIEEKSVLPAAFSLSVFNAPVALATISENLKGGYNAVYPSRRNFCDAFLAAAAGVASGKEKFAAFFYADEFVPKEYEALPIFRDDESFEKSDFFKNENSEFFQNENPCEKSECMQIQNDEIFQSEKNFPREPPLAFAALLSSQKLQNSVELNLNFLPQTVQDFLKYEKQN